MIPTAFCVIRELLLEALFFVEKDGKIMGISTFSATDFVFIFYLH